MADPTPDPALAAVVAEIEAHHAEAGWDQPGRLYALVETAGLVAREPELAEALGLDGDAPAGMLTPIQQEELPPGETVESLLETLEWPEAVSGCAAVVERLVLPPSADEELPEDHARAQEYAREHPERQEVRIVAGVTRGGASYCALRLRSHDDASSVLGGSDLVPGLVALLRGTFDLEGEQ